MSRTDLYKGRYSEKHREYFVTFVCKGRMNLFSNENLARLFCETIAINEEHCDSIWLTWVLMPDHFHGLLRLGETLSLSQTIKHLKGSTARKINIELEQSESIWQQGFFDRALRKCEDRRQVARYIVANPLRKRIVSNIGNYAYWDSVFL
ncbi:transposase [Colwellia sp. KU-HH00111]|uniref:REP-associated tyrosine transposase n=1 Tax=Colwellia sp. KU-HH00111 TaxID=3127652 RepID=UPI0031086D8F